jgi:uncharacterized protein (TIGR00369 family)
MESIDKARAIFAKAPFVAGLGIEPTVMREGRCETSMTLKKGHLQHTGQVHAGVVTTLADHTAGAAAQSMLTEGSFAITAELKISLLRAARGKTLTCSAVVIKAGRSLMFTEAEVYSREDEEAQPSLVAKLSATMAVVQMADDKAARA